MIAFRNISSDTVAGDFWSTWLGYLVDSSSNTVDITLPPAGGCEGQFVTVVDKTAGNLVRVKSSGSETIAGDASYSGSGAFKNITVASDGSNWFIVSNTGFAQPD